MRINLSEQTDIMDLLGSDLPKEGGKGGEFAWRDGVFLQALNVRIRFLFSLTLPMLTVFVEWRLGAVG